MRQDPLLSSIGETLRKFRKMESWMCRAGLPTFLARLPAWVLCLHYCMMMHGKTIRISRIAERIERWLETISELALQENARIEPVDLDHGMRNDLESTRRTLLALREVCVNVVTMFGGIGFSSRLLVRTQREFLAAVDHACITATSLQQALDTHDRRAVALLRQMEVEDRADAAGHATDTHGGAGETIVEA